MKTFALRDGDLVLTGDRYAMVEGAARLQQQAGLALTDPYGEDRFHPGWGSVLGSFVGQTYGANTSDYIKAEVLRVMRGYVATQSAMLAERATKSLRPNMVPEEILSSVGEIKIDQQQDAVSVKVSLTTASRGQVDVLTTAGGA